MRNPDIKVTLPEFAQIVIAIIQNLSLWRINRLPALFQKSSRREHVLSGDHPLSKAFCLQIRTSSVRCAERRYQSAGELIQDLKRALVDPSGEFVDMVPIRSMGDTVMISPERMARMKKRQGDGYDDEEYDDVYDDEEYEENDYYYEYD